MLLTQLCPCNRANTDDWEGAFLVLLHRRCALDLAGIHSGSGKFMIALNRHDLNIKLTYKYGHNNMHFLDVLLNTDDDGFMSSDLFRKTTATNTLLHARSSHPKTLMHNIPVGQYLRVKRICSQEEFSEKRASELHHHFKERGYPNHVIDRAYGRAKQLQR